MVKNDKLANRNLLNSTAQKAVAGLNNLPDFLENKEMGLADFGKPYFDHVKFYLTEDIETQAYVSCIITSSKNVSVTSTSIPGRGSNILQYIDKGGWDITFNIKLITRFGTIDNEVEDLVDERQVTIPKNKVTNTINTVKDPLSLVQSQSTLKYQNDFLPDIELSNLLSFFDEFYDNQTYQNIKVESKFLNNNLDVNYVIPYAIVTGQSPDFTNQYDITISCYSDINPDTSEYSEEIIPK